MSDAVPDDPVISLDDLADHTVTYGVDFFPPVDISKEAVRANTLFIELRERWPYLYETIHLGSADFKIQTNLEVRGKPAKVPFMTFSLTQRGPVFVFPQRLTALGGDVDLRGNNPADIFTEAILLFFRTFAGGQPIRAGVVRNLVFRTGSTNCTPWLGRAVLQFGDAKLVGAQCLLLYNDERYNITIQLSPVQLASVAMGPGAAVVTGQTNEFGLAVNLDVNNREVRPLSKDDIQELLNSEGNVWLGRFIQFLRTRTSP